ncbi:type VII secretion-associated protein, partial [Mycobacterium palustre]|nr:type VII secretion-associated protein [Mycobacterium palustre]
MRPATGPRRAIIEAGPGTIRRLCCGTTAQPDDDTSEIVGEALGAIDDRVALVAGRPVTVDSLWRSVFRSLECEHRDGLVLVHPSWWSSARVAVATNAAKRTTGEVVARPRAWLLAQAADGRRDATVVVEIDERLVVVTGARTAAIPRIEEPALIVEQTVAVVADMARGTATTVVIDAPATVAAAVPLGASLAAALRDGGRPVIEIGDARLCRVARSALAIPDEPRVAGGD